MLPKIKGNVAYVFDEADFDTDLICGMDTCTVADPEILKRVCMQDIAPDFQKYVEPGDVVVCGENFGYGHPHIGEPVGLQEHGISAFIAESFCPGFYRANTMRGTILIECPGILNEIKLGEHIEFDWENCQLYLLDSGRTIQCKPMPEKIIQMIECGGIMGYIRQVRLQEKRQKKAD